MLVEIKAIHEENRGVYGSSRIHGELKERQMHHGEKRVARQMHENGIKAKQSKRFRATADSSHSYPIAPNLLASDFVADATNRKSLAGIT